MGIEEKERNERQKLERTQALKSQIEYEYNELSDTKSKLANRKADLEQELRKIKNLINEDADEIKAEYDIREKEIQDKIHKMENDIEDAKRLCYRIIESNLY